MHLTLSENLAMNLTGLWLNGVFAHLTHLAHLSLLKAIRSYFYKIVVAGCFTTNKTKMLTCEDLFSDLLEEIEGLWTVANWNIAIQDFSGVLCFYCGLVAQNLGRRIKHVCQ